MSRRLRKLALWGAGLLALAVVGVLIAVPLAIRRVVTPDLIARQASNALDRVVSVGEVGLHFTPLLRVRLERVAIEPDIALGVVDVGLDIGSLLERRIEVGVVEIDDASVTLVRRADGGFELYGATPVADPEPEDPELEPEEPEQGPRLPDLPELDLRRIDVVLVDHAVADPPLRTRLRVHRLELERVADGKRPDLEIEAELGEDGQGGQLELEARLGPLDLARDLHEQPFEAELEVDGLATRPLVPYLSPHLDLRQLDGPLTGRASVEGESLDELAGQLAVSLADGRLHVAGAELSAPRFEGRLARGGGALSVTDARLATAKLRFDEFEAQDLDMAFSFADDSLEIDSLELDSFVGAWRSTTPSEGGGSEGAELELRVRRSGRIALRGRLQLPSASGRTAMDAAADIELPELEVQDAELVVVRGQGSDARTEHFHVERLQLLDFAIGESPRLSVEAKLGEAGEGGGLALEAKLDPLEAERAIAQHGLRAELQLDRLAADALVPYLPPELDLRRLTGRLTGRASLQGPSPDALAGELQVSLLAGEIDVAGVRLEAPRFTGRFAPEDGSVSVSDARLETRQIGFDEYQANDLSMAFSFAKGSLEVESLEFDSLAGAWRRAGGATSDDPQADELQVQVRRSGRISLRGRLDLPSMSELAGSGRVDGELPDLELRDAEIVISHATGTDPRPILLHLDHLELRDVGVGETATGRLEARLGEGGRGGSVSLRGSAGPLAWETPLTKLPVSLQLTLERLDLASLAKLLPEPWQLDPAEGRLGGRIDTEGRERANFSLQLDESRLGLRGIGLEGSAKLEGRVRTGAGGLAVEGGLLSAQTVTFAGRRAEDLQARFGYAEDTLGVESLELRAYQGSVSGSGRVGLGGEVPDLDVKLSATGVQAAPLFGTRPRSDEPTLLEAETAFRGRWTGEPNWLAPLEGGGRVEMRGGVFPSQALLSAIARSLVGLVPGFSRGAVSENPRLAGLEAFTSTFRVEEGRLVSDDLILRTEDLRVTGRGSLGHELDVDLRLLAALTTRGVATAFSMSRTHEQLRESTLLPAVPVRVTGPLGSQRYQVDARAMPVATLRGVLGLPARAGALGRGVAGTVRDTAGGVGNVLVGGARRLRGSGGPEEAKEPPQDLPE